MAEDQDEALDDELELTVGEAAELQSRGVKLPVVEEAVERVRQLFAELTEQMGPYRWCPEHVRRGAHCEMCKGWTRETPLQEIIQAAKDGTGGDVVRSDAPAALLPEELAERALLGLLAEGRDNEDGSLISADVAALIRSDGYAAAAVAIQAELAATGEMSPARASQLADALGRSDTPHMADLVAWTTGVHPRHIRSVLTTLRVARNQRKAAHARAEMSQALTDAEPFSRIETMARDAADAQTGGDGWYEYPDDLAPMVWDHILYRDDGEPLLPAATDGVGIHAEIIGERSAGKTWLALLAVVQAVLGGRRVVYWATDQTPRITALRLSRLGLSVAQMRESVRIFNISANMADIVASCRAWLAAPDKSGVVVIDTVAQAGCAGNDNQEAGQWINDNIAPWREAGHLVLALDHIAKDGKDGYSRGASAKTNAAKLTLVVESKGGMWNAHVAGETYVTLARDGEAFLSLPEQTRVATLYGAPTDDGHDIQVLAPTPIARETWLPDTLGDQFTTNDVCHAYGWIETCLLDPSLGASDIILMSNNSIDFQLAKEFA